MNDALRRRLDACYDDDVTVQAEAVPELVALVRSLDAELEETLAVLAAGLASLCPVCGEHRECVGCGHRW